MDCFKKLLLLALAFLFALFLASFCAPAKAQVQGIQIKCLPFGLLGESTTRAPFVERSDVGWHIWIYCRDPYVGIVAQGFNCPHGECVTFDVAVREARSAINGGATSVLDALTRAVAYRCSESGLPAAREAACRKGRELMLASMPQEPKPVWKVAINPGATTRPAYPLVDGVRGRTANGRATVGADCDCSARSVEGSSVYCGVNGRTDQVALCRRQS